MPGAARRLRRGWLTGLSAVLAGGLVAGAAQACTPALSGEGVRQLRSDHHTVAWRPAPQPIPMAAPFAVELAVCAIDGRLAIEAVAVDADMPAHRHGMNYRASVAVLGAGRYRADGLLFHMPGEWRLIVELRAGGRVERLTDAFVVE